MLFNEIKFYESFVFSITFDCNQKLSFRFKHASSFFSENVSLLVYDSYSCDFGGPIVPPFALHCKLPFNGTLRLIGACVGSKKFVLSVDDAPSSTVIDSAIFGIPKQNPPPQ